MSNVYRLEKNINRFYLFSFLQDLSFFTPIFVIFLQANQLSLEGIMILQSLYLLFNLLLEIPTGIIADKYGYKKSLIAGSFFCALGFMIFAVGNNFIDFLLAMIMYAIGATLMSGADEAFLFETLKEMGREIDYPKIFGRARAVTVLGVTLASIIGGYMAEYSMRATFILSAISLIFMFLINLSLIEPKHIGSSNSLKELTGGVMKFVFSNSKIKWCISFFAFINLVIWGTYFLYQPYFQKLGIPIKYFGIIFAGLNIFVFFASIYFNKIKKYFSDTQIIYFMLTLTALPLLFVYGFFSIPFIAFFILHQVLRGFLSPFISHLINSFVGSENRATILSINNMFSRGIQFIFFPMIGFLANRLDIRNTFLILFIFSIMVSFIILIKFYGIFVRQKLIKT